jgi:large subunit ribosomal protein L13
MKKSYTKYVYEKSGKWLIVNAEGRTLGRFAAEIAKILMGKNKVTYTPSADTGDFVIVYNAEKIKVTGNKFDEKPYYTHSRFPGGLKKELFRDKIIRNPESILLIAVKGMLPKNKLASKLLTKLKVYSGTEHPHDAQGPVAIEIGK